MNILKITNNIIDPGISDSVSTDNSKISKVVDRTIHDRDISWIHMDASKKIIHSMSDTTTIDINSHPILNIDNIANLEFNSITANNDIMCISANLNIPLDTIPIILTSSNGISWTVLDFESEFIPSTSIYEIGDTGPGGGYIYHIDDTNPIDPKYYEVALYDQSTGNIWSNISLNIGTTNTEIGYGNANTDDIIAQSNHTTSAAQICRDATINDINDWYLPSKDELNKVWENIVASGDINGGVGGFSESLYWTSSEESANFAYTQSFENGTSSNNSKGFSSPRIRAVRDFIRSDVYNPKYNVETAGIEYIKEAKVFILKLKETDILDKPNIMYHSYDGIAWIRTNIPIANAHHAQVLSVCYFNSRITCLVRLTNATDKYYILTTKNFLSWITYTVNIPLNDKTSIGVIGSRLVMFSGVNGRVYRTSDIRSWSSTLLGITSNQSKFINNAEGTEIYLLSDKIYVSVNGISWSSISDRLDTSNSTTICYSGETGNIVTNSGTSISYRSRLKDIEDTLTWVEE